MVNKRGNRGRGRGRGGRGKPQAHKRGYGGGSGRGGGGRGTTRRRSSGPRNNNVMQPIRVKNGGIMVSLFGIYKLYLYIKIVPG